RHRARRLGQWRDGVVPARGYSRHREHDAGAGAGAVPVRADAAGAGGAREHVRRQRLRRTGDPEHAGRTGHPRADHARRGRQHAGALPGAERGRRAAQRVDLRAGLALRVGRDVQATERMTMDRKAGDVALHTVLAGALSLAIVGVVHAQSAPSDAERIEQLEAKLEAQGRELQDLRLMLADQQRAIQSLDERGAQAHALDELRARGGAAGGSSPLSPAFVAAGAATPAAAMPAAQAKVDGDDGPMQVGRPPEELSRPPEIAQIFEQPGVLTPRGRFVLEPSLQLGYSSNDRVALVGYTVIPAILIGLIDVRQVKTTSGTAALAGRYGVSNRFELELKVPYTYVSGDTVSREIF